MSIYYRIQFYREQIVLKDLHLANISKTLVDILPIGFSFQDYLEAFKIYYPHKWEDIYSYCHIRKNGYQRRIRKRLRTVSFLIPRHFLRCMQRLNKRTKFEDTFFEHWYEVHISITKREYQNDLTTFK